VPAAALSYRLTYDSELITDVLDILIKRTADLLGHRGRGPGSDPEESNPLLRDQPWLAGFMHPSWAT